jgi:ribonuclease HI
LRRGTASSSPACFESFERNIDAQEYWQGWFDGAALPNPGKIGIGVVLISPAGVRSDQSALVAGCGCNNEAELHALCAALEIAGAAGARRVVLHSDSDVVVRYVNGPDSTQIARLAALVSQARQKLRDFDEVQLIWIPRHRNLEADRLSRQALGLPVMAPKVAKGRRRSR